MIGRMRRLQTHDAEKWPPTLLAPCSMLRAPCSCALGEQVGLVTPELFRLRQPRAVQPWIVEQETAFKAFPHFKSAAALRRHDLFRVNFADKRRRPFALRQMPLPE